MAFADANEYLSSKGVQSSKFENIGDTHTGRLVDADRMVKTNTQGEIQFRQDGVTPQEQLVLTWETEERSLEIPGDTGLRKLYCSWRLEAGIKNAMRAAGGKGLEADAVLTVTFVSEEKIPKVAGKAKLYEVEYQLPAKKIGTAAAQPSTTAAAPAAASAPAENPTDAQLAQANDLFDKGVAISVISLATGISEHYLNTEIFVQI